MFTQRNTTAFESASPAFLDCSMGKRQSLVRDMRSRESGSVELRQTYI
jgi:hypothetical protein